MADLVQPYVADPDFALHVGDVREVLAELPDESVDCAATSPPFYGLRDYGTGFWEGGDSDHEHDTVGARGGRGGSGTLDKRSADAMPSRLPAHSCSCGAEYRDPQIGLEETPEAYVAELVAVFRRVRRTLKPHGSLWVECGDSYASLDGQGNLDEQRPPGQNGKFRVSPNLGKVAENRGPRRRSLPGGYKRKDLLGTPWLLAFALRADGWWLRQAIIWHKPNAMPESATDRCTTGHSYVFLLSKQARYFFDAEAIAEPAEWARWGDQTVPKYEGTETASGWMQPKTKAELRRGVAKRAAMNELTEARSYSARIVDGRAIGGPTDDATKNARSVWTIPTRGYPEAHFATWPEALVERIIKAGCPLGGTVLDPFMGSGTTALVARKLGRRSIGIELNPEYAELAARRLSQLSLLAEEAS